MTQRSRQSLRGPGAVKRPPGSLRAGPSAFKRSEYLLPIDVLDDEGFILDDED